jgi:hypothetical protein
MAGKRGSLTAVRGQAPPAEETADLATAVGALEREKSPTSEPVQQPAQEPPGRMLRGASARRALLTVLGGLVIGGVVTLLVIDGPKGSRGNRGYVTADRANVVFSSAHSGDCLTWPRTAPDQPSFVQCKDAHLFEVAESVDMRSFQAPCEEAVRRYLGSHYDPNSKFSIAVLWPGNAATAPSGEPHLLCGLQLPGPDGQPVPVTGRVAELDQSKLGPAPVAPPPVAPPPVAPPPVVPPPVAPAPPVAPPPVAPEPTATSSPAPATTTSIPSPSTAPATTTSASPTITTTTAPSATPSPSATAPPQPPEAVTTTSEAPAGQVIEVPGMAPITVPVLIPPGPAQ